MVEDEKEHLVSVVTLDADGRVGSTALTAGIFQMFSDFWTLDDLEGLALDRAGFVYAITSHCPTDGQRTGRRRLGKAFRRLMWRLGE